jgi:hypothetical protein
MHRLPLVSLFALLAACGLSRDNFFDKFNGAVCEWTMECDEEDGDVVWDDQNECEEHYPIVIHESDYDNYDDCDFDKDAAKDCLDAVRNLGCDLTKELSDHPEVCDKVWDCPDYDDRFWDTGR